MADAAALLHGQGGFLQAIEDPVHRVGNGAHDEAVEQGDAAAGAGASEDPAGGEKAVVLHDGLELFFPISAAVRRLGSSQRRATRCQVASTDGSSGAPPSDLRRYLRSQISREIGSAAAERGVIAFFA